MIVEHPILFRPELVLAILADRKTVTRRIVKLPLKGPWIGHKRRVFGPDDFADPAVVMTACPYGQPGDRLWVRETWAAPHPPAVYYKADGPRSDDGTWRPSIHMPRWACRLVLDVVNVRVERLQDITEADAKAEGVSPEFEVTTEDFLRNPKWKPESTYRLGFKHKWDDINAKRAPWSSNPWVWRIGFKRVEAPAKEAEGQGR